MSDNATITDDYIQRVTADYEAWANSLSREEFYAFRRARMVEHCSRFRRVMGKTSPEFAAALLRDIQLRMVRLRSWYSTGIWPGTA